MTFNPTSAIKHIIRSGKASTFSTSFLLLFLFSSLSFAQELKVDWKKEYGGHTTGVCHHLLELTNGQLVSTGAIHTKGEKTTSLGYLRILDANSGKLLIQKKYDQFPNSCFYDAVQTPDGGLLLAGFMTKDKNKVALMVKTDEKGKALWHLKVEDGNQNEFTEIAIDEFEHIFISGYQNKQPRLLKIYRQNIVWDKLIGKNSLRSIDDLVATKDQVVMIGTTKSNKIWWAKLNSNGTEVMTPRTFGRKSEYAVARDLLKLDQEGFAIAGMIRQKKHNDLDLWLIKINENGSLDWDRKYGGEGDDYAVSLSQKVNGSFVLVGDTKSHRPGATFHKIQVLETDDKGIIQEDKTAIYGGEKDNTATAILRLHDGSFGLAGTVDHLANGKGKILMMKIKPESLKTTLSVKGDTPLEWFDLHFIDNEMANGDSILNAGERGYLSFKMRNSSQSVVPDIKIIIQAEGKIRGLHFNNWKESYTGLLTPGAVRQFNIPIRASEDLQSGLAKFKVSLYNRKFNKKLGSLWIAVPCIGKEGLDEAKLEALGFLSLQPTSSKGTQRSIPWDKPYLPLKATFFHRDPIQVQNIGIYINDISFEDVKDVRGKVESYTIKKIFHHTFERRVPLVEGENQIVLNYQNSWGNAVFSDTILVNFSANKPNLHLLSIGVPYPDLNYTDEDARDFVNAMQSQEGVLFNKVFHRTLSSQTETTIENLETALDELVTRYQEADHPEQIFERDLLVLFISAHGKIIDDRFKILSSEYYAKKQNNGLLDYEQNIIQLLDQIPCKKLLLIDACHSGGLESTMAAKAPIEDFALSEALIQLNEEVNGMSILASCREDEFSFEDKEWENGAFTKGILDAFSGQTFEHRNDLYQADTSEDNYPVGVLTIKELYQFLQKHVPNIVSNKNSGLFEQTPYMPESQLDEELPLFYVNPSNF